MRTHKTPAGFTLIELMVTIAIIATLAAVALPKFAGLLRKAHEGATKGNLGTIRSALSIYYGDLQGVFPVDPNTLTIGGKYLAEVPISMTPDYHQNSPSIALVSQGDGWTDAGGWAYDYSAADRTFGTISVNCTHTDTKSSVWTDY